MCDAHEHAHASFARTPSLALHLVIVAFQKCAAQNILIVSHAGWTSVPRAETFLRDFAPRSGFFPRISEGIACGSSWL
jgi:hypothetical protein